MGRDLHRHPATKVAVHAPMLTKNVDPPVRASLVSGRVIAKLCPKCFSPNVRRSRRRSLGDHLAILVFRQPYRCRMCRHRYMQFIFGEQVRGRDFHLRPADREKSGAHSPELGAGVRSSEVQSREDEARGAQSQKV